MSNFHDIDLVCICGRAFVWTKGEQEFMNDLLEKGKINELQKPRRCKECRLKKKREKERRGS